MIIEKSLSVPYPYISYSLSLSTFSCQQFPPHVPPPPPPCTAEVLIPKSTQKLGYPIQQPLPPGHSQNSSMPSTPKIPSEKKFNLTTLAPELLTLDCSFTHVLLAPNTHPYHS